MVANALRDDVPEEESTAFIVPRGMTSETSPYWNHISRNDGPQKFLPPEGWNKDTRELFRQKLEANRRRLPEEDRKVLKALLPGAPLGVVSGCTSELLRIILDICDTHWSINSTPNIPSMDEDLWQSLYRVASSSYIMPVLSALLKAMESLAAREPRRWFRFCFDEGWVDGMKTCLRLSFAPLAAPQVPLTAYDSSTISHADDAWERLNHTYFQACAEEIKEEFLIISTKADKAGVHYAPLIEPSTAHNVFFTCEHHYNMNRTRQCMRIRGGKIVRAHAWFVTGLRRLQDCLQKYPSARTIRDFPGLLTDCGACRKCASKARSQVIDLMEDLAERVSKRLERVRFPQMHTCVHVY